MDNENIIKCTTSVKTIGIDPVPVIVECQVSKGIGIHIVGLADAEVKESLLRTVTAIQACGYKIPGKRIIINLAPADVRKSGCGYDLPIALTVLAASENVTLPELGICMIVGELELSGKIRCSGNSFAAVQEAIKNEKIEKVILPRHDANDILNIFKPEGVHIFGVETLAEAIEAIQSNKHEMDHPDTVYKKRKDESCWNQIVGNQAARRALEIAAAGGHHMVLMGAPGSQKGTIAKALSELLGPMDENEKIENAAIYSKADRLSLFASQQDARPYRAPHYSASISAMIGGGAGDNVLPGEVTLANNGVLHLDDIVSMPKSTLESLRAPLEDRQVTISRLRRITRFPAKFQLVASLNPCPCGYYGEGDRCTCSPTQREMYMNRNGNPVMDRIDLQVMTRLPNRGEEQVAIESLDTVMKRIALARQMQEKRFGNKVRLNADITSKEYEQYCKLDKDTNQMIEMLITRLGLSVRAYTRILRIARTIADLAGREEIITTDLAEAASYRFLDRKNA